MAENYSESIDVNNLFNRLSYLFAYLAMIALYLFSRKFAGKTPKNRLGLFRLLMVLATAVILGWLVTSSQVVGIVSYDGMGGVVFTQGSLVLLSVPIYLLLGGGVIYNLLGKIKTGNYAEKNQARFIIFGLSFALFVSLSVNIVMPAVFGQTDQTSLSNTLLTLMLALITSYALIKHRILDIRPFASNFIAGGFLLLTVGLLYALAILFLQSEFFGSLALPSSVLMAYVAVLLVIGLAVHPLHRFYRRLLDRVFIRNLYNSQAVIDSLNKVFISNLKTDPLLAEVQSIVRRSFGAKFTVIKLQRKDRNVYHQGRSPVTLADLAKLDVELARVYPGRKHVVSLGEIIMDPRKKHLAEMMIEEKVSVIAPIRHGVSLLGVLYISDKKYELPYSGRDLKVIEIIVDQMALAIENSRLYEEVTEFNDTLKARVHLATKELRHTNDQLIAMDKAKDEFISISSHQLRTPLTTVKGYISMILDGNFGRVQKAMRPALSESLDSTQRMSFVVSDLINLVRLRTGKLDVDLKKIDLKVIIRSESESVTDTLSRQNLTLEVILPDKPVSTLLDEVKIRQAIKNLIYNAIFYTPPGGRISIVLEDKPEEILFKVVDSGIGVPTSEHKLLFTQFYRSKNAQKLRPDGTGVGLYITKAILSAHGGKMVFESDEDKGSTFGFVLPKHQ